MTSTKKSGGIASKRYLMGNRHSSAAIKRIPKREKRLILVSRDFSPFEVARRQAFTAENAPEIIANVSRRRTSDITGGLPSMDVAGPSVETVAGIAGVACQSPQFNVS